MATHSFEFKIDATHKFEGTTTLKPNGTFDVTITTPLAGDYPYDHRVNNLETLKSCMVAIAKFGYASIEVTQL